MKILVKAAKVSSVGPDFCLIHCGAKDCGVLVLS